MDSSDLRLIIGLLFGTFLLIVVLSDAARRKPKSPRMKVKDSGFRRPSSSSDTGFRRSQAPPATPRPPRRDWKVPRN